MTDLRSISIQYENKINGLYALFVSLERVNMRYIEKMKSRNNNPQTAKQQLKARLQICNNMKEVLKNTKKYEDVLTDEQKNLLPNSCNIDPLKPHSESLTELTNPYFKKPPTKQAKIPDLLIKEKSTVKFKKDKLSKISSSPDTTVSSKDIPQPSQDTVQSSGENSPTTSSAILKRVHPWCKISQAKEETKDESTQKVYPAKQKPSVESTKTSQRSLISSNSPEIEDTQDTEECSLKKQFKLIQAKEEIKDESTQKVYPAKQKPSVESTKTSQRSLIEDTQDTEECSLKKQLADNTVKGNNQKEKKEIKKKHSSLSSLKTTIPEQKANIKYRQRKYYNPSMVKKRVLSIEENEEAYPWEKEAAKNRENEMPLSNKTRKIKESINKLLPQPLKSKLYQYIEYPDNVNNKIDNKIERKGKEYVCINCVNNPSFSSTR